MLHYRCATKPWVCRSVGVCDSLFYKKVNQLNISVSDSRSEDQEMLHL
jgi:hypothetical protein